MKKPGKPKPKRRAHKAAPVRHAATGGPASGGCANALASASSKASSSKASSKASVKSSTIAASKARDRHSSLSNVAARQASASSSPHRTVRAIAAEDRTAFALLLLPFLIIAVALTMVQSRRSHLPSLPEIAIHAPTIRITAAPVAVPVVPAPNEIVVPGTLAAYPPPTPVLERALAGPASPTVVADLDPPRIVTRPAPQVPTPNEVVVPAPAQAFPPPVAVVESLPTTPTIATAGPSAAASVEQEPTTPPSPRDITIASLDTRKPAPIALPEKRPENADRAPLQPADLTCSPSPERLASFANVGRLARARSQPRLVGVDSATFGRRLAAAAVAQTEDLVIYTARYQPMAYPMGDVMPLHGACIDVVIRAYRTLGIDLQEEIQRGRPSRGDTNIDHRRTENMRRFLERAGASLPITSYPEDYKPGDIVTYHRPFSRISTSHIAVVTDVLAASRRPMIVHNRGYGPQLEDALFVDRITGHYRYSGPPLVAAKTETAPGTSAATAVAPVERASFPAGSAAVKTQRALELQSQ